MGVYSENKKKETWRRLKGKGLNSVSEAVQWRKKHFGVIDDVAAADLNLAKAIKGWRATSSGHA